MEVILTIIIVILTVAVAVLSIYTLFFYKEQRQTKIICAISIILSVIAILCSIRISPFKISDIAAFIGVIAGVMALPTAVVVGWNIYSVIDTKGIIKKHEILKKRTTNEIGRLKTLIKEQDAEKEKLRNYVNTVQNFTMANIRMTENKYGDALGIYCIAAINLYEIVKIDENKTDDEQNLMDKSIRNAYNIVNEDKTIRGSQLLTNMHSDILKGLKEIRFKDVKTQEIVGIQIQTIITAIEKDYPQTEEPQSK